MNRLNDLYLQEFSEIRRARRGPDSLFSITLVLCLAGFALLAVGVKRVKVTEAVAATAEVMRQMKVSFNLAQEPEKKKIAKPADLTQKTELAGKANITGRPAAAPDASTARAVYGLRRIFATGLGTGEGGGSGSNALVAKLGNTLDKTPDTLTATEKDLKGKLVSVTTVSKMPQIRVSAKPEYTEEMKKNRVEGTVSAKLLVDMDGTVKQVILLNDLGYGSREAAMTAFKKLVFEPATENDNPVAVWIVMKFKFVLQAS